MANIPEGDYEKGKKLFKQRCFQCHVVDSNQTKTGPTLKGVINRKSGSVEGFDYSAANKNKVCFDILYYSYTVAINGALFILLSAKLREKRSNYKIF